MEVPLILTRQIVKKKKKKKILKCLPNLRETLIEVQSFHSLCLKIVVKVKSPWWCRQQGQGPWGRRASWESPLCGSRSHKEVGEGDQAQLVEQSYACFTLALGVFSYQTTYRHPPTLVMGWPPGVTRSVYHLEKSNTAPTTLLIGRPQG